MCVCLCGKWYVCVFCVWHGVCVWCVVYECVVCLMWMQVCVVNRVCVWCLGGVCVTCGMLYGCVCLCVCGVFDGGVCMVNSVRVGGVCLTCRHGVCVSGGVCDVGVLGCSQKWLYPRAVGKMILI